MTLRMAVVAAFMYKQPPHSPYNIFKLAHTLADMPLQEVILIANGCRLTAPDKQELQQLPRTRLIEAHPNIGVPSAWNIGLDSSNCDILFILNDDVYIDYLCFEKIAAVFEKMPDTAVAGVEGFISERLDDQGFPHYTRHVGPKKHFWQSSGQVDVTMVCGFLFAVSMKFIKNTGFRFDLQFSPAFCEELDIAFSARTHGYKIRVTTDCQGHYHHLHGVSEKINAIEYQGTSINTLELSQRNMRLFAGKWQSRAGKLIMP